MAISLRPNEQIKMEVQFHWSAFIIAKVWAVLGIMTYFIIVIGHFTKTVPDDSSVFGQLIVNTLVFIGPFSYKWLQNKHKIYLVTNQRVYIEEGVLSKSKRDLPLDKINDLAMSQGFLQRLVGSGNILILTGNDKPTRFRDIEHPEAFKMAISEMAEKKSLRAA